MDFAFEHAVVSSDSVKEEGVLIVPQGFKDLHPLFVPTNRSVPFFLKNEGYILEDYFNTHDDKLNNIVNKSSNLLSLWKELEDAEVIDHECVTYILLDKNSNILLEISQIDNYYDNMLEVKVVPHNILGEIMQIALEQDVLLGKIMYEKYMEINKISSTELLEEFKKYGDNGSYSSKVSTLLGL